MLTFRPGDLVMLREGEGSTYVFKDGYITGDIFYDHELGLVINSAGKMRGLARGSELVYVVMSNGRLGQLISHWLIKIT
jgi:hypothetical protein